MALPPRLLFLLAMKEGKICLQFSERGKRGKTRGDGFTREGGPFCIREARGAPQRFRREARPGRGSTGGRSGAFVSCRER